MRAVILADGRGTRLSEETLLKPKPMVEVGDYPLIWHVIAIYAYCGIRDFIVCLGYKGWQINEYFLAYVSRSSDVTIELSSNPVEIHRKAQEDWRITLIDTGGNTQTGGWIKRVADYIDGKQFCMTYGDAVTDLDIVRTITFDENHGRDATITAVRPRGRFGAVRLEGNEVVEFKEKPVEEGGYINGGSFVLEPSVIDLIEDDATIWEHGPLERLAAERRLQAYCHEGFWHCVDTLRDKQELKNIWIGGEEPWKTW